MLVLVVALAVTNVVTLGVLAYRWRRPPEPPGPDAVTADALDRAAARRPVPTGSTRRIISIEILNPIELAGTRGRLAGIAGSLAPRLTRRIVYDQTLKIVEEQLRQHQVVADVRVHTLRPVPPTSRPDDPVQYTDVVEPVEFDGAAPADRPPEHQPPV